MGCASSQDALDKGAVGGDSTRALDGGVAAAKEADAAASLLGGFSMQSQMELSVHCDGLANTDATSKVGHAWASLPLLAGT
jgi:hypothetical protein